MPDIIENDIEELYDWARFDTPTYEFPILRNKDLADADLQAAYDQVRLECDEWHARCDLLEGILEEHGIELPPTSEQMMLRQMIVDFEGEDI